MITMFRLMKLGAYPYFLYIYFCDCYAGYYAPHCSLFVYYSRCICSVNIFVIFLIKFISYVAERIVCLLCLEIDFNHYYSHFALHPGSYQQSSEIHS